MVKPETAERNAISQLVEQTTDEVIDQIAAESNDLAETSIQKFDADKRAEEINSSHESQLSSFEDEVKGMQDEDMAKLSKTLKNVNNRHNDQLFKLRFTEGRLFKDTVLEKHGIDISKCGIEMVNVPDETTGGIKEEPRYYNKYGITRINLAEITCQKLAMTRGSPEHAKKMKELHEKMLAVNTTKMQVLSMNVNDVSYVSEKSKLTDVEVDLERFKAELGITPEEQTRFGGLMETFTAVMLNKNQARQKHFTARINANKSKLDIISKVQKNFTAMNLESKLMHDLRTGDAKRLVK